MTREVDFYELKQSRRMIAGCEVRYFKLASTPPQWLPGGEMAVDKATAQEERVPIHHVRAAGKNKYIAMSPELREILEAPFEAKALDVQAKLRIAEDCVSHMEDRLAWFPSQPWYKRLWIALRGLPV
jgi:hypothetical protein